MIIRRNRVSCLKIFKFYLVPNFGNRVLGNNVSWFVHLYETWLGNNVSWLVHLYETWLGNNVSWFVHPLGSPSGNYSTNHAILTQLRLKFFGFLECGSGTEERDSR